MASKERHSVRMSVDMDSSSMDSPASDDSPFFPKPFRQREEAAAAEGGPVYTPTDSEEDMDPVDQIAYLQSVLAKQKKQTDHAVALLRAFELPRDFTGKAGRDATMRMLLAKIADSIEESAAEAVELFRCKLIIAKQRQEMSDHLLQLEDLMRELTREKSENTAKTTALRSYASSSVVELSKRNAERFKNDRMKKQLDLLHQCIDHVTKLDTPLTLPSTSVQPRPPLHSTSSVLGVSNVCLPGERLPQNNLDVFRKMRVALLYILRQNSVLSSNVRLMAKSRAMLEAKIQSMQFEMKKMANTIKEGATSGGGVSSPTARRALTSALRHSSSKHSEFRGYEPIAPGIHGIQRDFLNFLYAGGGYLRTRFLDELSIKQQRAAIAGLCIDWYAYVTRDGLLRSMVDGLDRVLQITDINLAFAAIIKEIRKALQCDRVTVWMVDEENGDMWTLKFSTGLVGSELRIPLGVGLAGVAYESGEAVNVPDAYEDERFNRTVDLQTGYRTRSVLCLPIVRIKDAPSVPPAHIQRAGSGAFDRSMTQQSMTSTQVVAIIQCINKFAGPFTEEDIFLLSFFAPVATNAVFNCQRSAAAEWLIMRKEMLFNMADEMSRNCYALPDILNAIHYWMDTIFKVADCQLCLIGKKSLQRCHRAQKEEEEPFCPSAAEPDRRRGSGLLVEPKPLCGLVAQCAATRLPSTAVNAKEDPAFSRLVDLHLDGAVTHSYPVFLSPETQHKVIAVLQFTIKQRQSQFVQMQLGGFDPSIPRHQEILKRMLRLLSNYMQRLVLNDPQFAGFF